MSKQGEPRRRETMFSIGCCRLCETGPLGLRKCGACEKIVVLCDECDAVWTTTDTAAAPVVLGNEDVPCPLCEASLFGQASAWASREEVEATDWLASAIDSGRVVLEMGAPLSPDGLDHGDDAGPLDTPMDAGG